MNSKQEQLFWQCYEEFEAIQNEVNKQHFKNQKLNLQWLFEDGRWRQTRWSAMDTVKSQKCKNI